MINNKRKNDELYDNEPYSLKDRFTDLVMWLPSLSFMTLVALYLLASLEVGHLPLLNHPEPQNTIFAPFMNVVWIGLLVSLSVLPFGIVFTIFHFVEHQSLSTVWTRLALYVLPLIVFFVLSYYSPIMFWFK